VSEAQQMECKNIKHDIAVPISSIAEFIRLTDAALAAAYPGVRHVTFGHLGDGNLHYNVAPPVGVDPERFVSDDLEAVNRIVHDQVVRMNGSISAEHGIGQLKRDELRHYKSALEIELMQRVKAALDPDGIMNPGKVL